MPRTSTTGRCNRGFTLLELVVVILIISLVFTLAVPAFRHNSAHPEALRMASLLRELNDSSIAMKKKFDITFDLDTAVVSWTGPDGKRSAHFKELKDVQTPSRGTVREGTLKVIFDAQGAPEDINVYMESGAGTYKVSLNELSGRVRVSSVEKK
ncbi:MAG: prepilin-type N-terminal cleavage/methylation domain-containing protein [Nitrospiraceae bacterium]|nr:prepilin-type N-terminal cleavage/methylation domain-containing protein [Nitrospiraceae bacterium]